MRLGPRLPGSATQTVHPPGGRYGAEPAHARIARLHQSRPIESDNKTDEVVAEDDKPRS